LTSKLLSTYKQRITDLKLIPGSGGCFELTANGELVYSKLQTGKFPDERALVETIGSRLPR
jgi:selenoprotein W-related protein